MSERSSEVGLWRQAALIAVVGIVVGFLYNHLGLQAKPVWGMAWIQVPQGEAATLDDVLAATPGLDPSEDDFPMATGDDPAGMSFDTAPSGTTTAAAPPDIPELGRPIQMQLPAVKSFHDADAAIIIDSREPFEYEEGHIAGSISLPYDEAITDPVRLETLQTDGKPLIVYCGGGTCELSLNLAWSLIEAGHPKVLVFMGGYPEWTDAGYPIETGLGADHE